MNKRLIVFIFIGILVIAIGVFALFKLGIIGGTNTNSNLDQTTGQLPAVSTSSAQTAQNLTPAVTQLPTAPQGATFQMGTSQGTVTVNNFYKMPLVMDDEFLILNTSTAYQINYDTETSQFYIAFPAAPSADLRTQAETAFRSLLGVSSDDACKLNVAEGYPGNFPIAPEQHDLSFCG